MNYKQRTYAHCLVSDLLSWRSID